MRRLHAECARLARGPVLAVGDRHVDAEPRQADREHEPARAGTHHEHVGPELLTRRIGDTPTPAPRGIHSLW
ncbi:hypothetical protein GCM10011372_18660 [Agromyces bauzanensis]|uniref:Uncharacterized protein n=1 Tax=Agromyces bauzanensis TaxID=1308924 RepID=A0A917URS1_9MICO|nr:hypothetical protein GCM10011372_18660 [Agromyces bauzanensis]